MKSVLATGMLASLAAFGAMALAAPANAQSYDYRRGDERAYGAPHAGRAGDTGFQIERLGGKLGTRVELPAECRAENLSYCDTHE